MIERAAITVLGSQGFIGSRLTREFIRRGDRFWAPVRQDREIFDRPLGIVYYCIGLTADYSTRPFDTVEAHVGYLAQLVERANFDYIIYLSSTRLYDDLCAPEADGDTVLKFNPNNPRHLYDLSKALGENILRTIVPERSSILRLSSVYDFEAGSPGFLSHLIQRIRDERLINLDSSATYYRDYIFIDDVVLSLIAIARYRPCGIINVASGKNTSNQDIANTLRPFGIDIQFNRNNDSVNLPVCNIERLEALGISPSETLHKLIDIVESFAS